MSKKINEELKHTEAFAFAKAIHGFNTRESARFASLFTSGADFVGISKLSSLTRKYLFISREPDLRSNSQSVTLDSRSKVVMAYEKQRKAFLKIKELRLKEPHKVDSIVLDVDFDCGASRDLGYRCHMLQELLRQI